MYRQNNVPRWAERKKKKCKQAESTLDAAETNAHFSSFPSFQPLDRVYVHKCDLQNLSTKLQECILVAMVVTVFYYLSFTPNSFKHRTGELPSYLAIAKAIACFQSDWNPKHGQPDAD